jgi:aryl-alcohol dehydrogenase-like predicted oxidoreductase
MALNPHFRIGGELPVRRIGFGAARLLGKATWGEPRDPAGCLAVLRRAAALGVNLFDTAEAYGPHVNERQIAEALAPYPEGVIIATKCGLTRVWPADADHPRLIPKGRRQDIRASLEGSLERLRLERIDLYQLHRIDPQVPLEESVAALAELQAEGRVRHIGLSEVTLAELQRAEAVAPIATVQNRYNLVERQHEAVLDHCARRGIGFIPWYPLGQGQLTAADGPLAGIARRLGATPSQVALAWLLHRSPVLLAIPGTTSVAHLEQNLQAIELRLDPADMDALETIGRAAAAQISR